MASRTINLKIDNFEKISDWTTVAVFNVGDKRQATIDIEGVIGFEPWWEDDKKTTTKELMKNELKRIANLDVDTIKVQINSYGGDVNHAVSMHDLLVESKAKVITEVHGHTASAATIIAQAGNTRRMSSTALYLTHQAQTIAMGTADDMEATKKTLDTINNQIAEIYAKRSGKSVAEMREVMDRNNGLGEWITADEALELGLIDEITEPVAVAACAVPTRDMLDVWNLPEIPQPTKTKEPVNMFDKLKKMFNFTDEQSEILDALESIESLDNAHQAKVDALTSEVETLKAEVADKVAEIEVLNADKEKFENASKLAEELSEAIVDLESDNKELVEKLDKLTANVNAPEQVEDTVQVVNIVEQIKNRMAADGCTYENAYAAILKENAELHNQLVVSKRK